MQLANVNLTPTMKCNLRCKLCGVLVPHYEYCPQMSCKEFSDTMKALYEVIDYIERIQITGGEPLLHPELDKMLQNCFEYKDRFGELWFFSNCAVPFRKPVLDVLEAHKDKVMIHCSDYGVRLKVAESNIQLLESAHIPYRYLKYYGDSQYCDGWVDNGDFVSHNRTKEENEAVFAACSHVCRGGSWYIRHGQMHWCGRSVRGTELGKIPLCEEDYLDILDRESTVEEKRDKLAGLLQVRSVKACDYCNGYYGTEDIKKRHPAGEQM